MSILPVPSNHGLRYKALVRTPAGQVHVGTFDTPDLATQGALDFIETGVKPPPLKRGPRGKHVNRRAPVPRNTSEPKPRFDRVAMMRKIAGWEPTK